jgi:hypothetical protein
VWWCVLVTPGRRCREEIIFQGHPQIKKKTKQKLETISEN